MGRPLKGNPQIWLRLTTEEAEFLRDLLDFSVSDDEYIDNKTEEQSNRLADFINRLTFCLKEILK